MTGIQEDSGWKFKSDDVQLLSGSDPYLFATMKTNLERAKAAAQQNTCINHLRLIDGAKQQWALENGKSLNNIPTWEDIKPYLGRGGSGIPLCPAGGTYQLNSVAQNPTCTVPGHQLR
jgi:hypothetical protein